MRGYSIYTKTGWIKSINYVIGADDFSGEHHVEIALDTDLPEKVVSDAIYYLNNDGDISEEEELDANAEKWAEDFQGYLISAIIDDMFDSQDFWSENLDNQIESLTEHRSFCKQQYSNETDEEKKVYYYQQYISSIKALSAIEYIKNLFDFARKTTDEEYEYLDDCESLLYTALEQFTNYAALFETGTFKYYIKKEED